MLENVRAKEYGFHQRSHFAKKQCLISLTVEVEKTMYLDFDNLRFYNHRSADICAASAGTSPLYHPDPELTNYTVETLGSFIVQCGGIKNSVLSSKCYLGNFESSEFSWHKLQMGVGMELPYLVPIGSKVCSDVLHD